MTLTTVLEVVGVPGVVGRPDGLSRGRVGGRVKE